ncbi:MAG: hypothetical protein R2861_13320 [Desulfobacterales bacterium]
MIRQETSAHDDHCGSFLKFDPIYEPYCRCFLENPEAFAGCV